MSSNLSIVDTLVERNKKYAEEVHKPLPPLYGADGKPNRTPGVLIVTCVDPRIIPETFLGFKLPGLSPIALPAVRVIGGRARHALVNIVGLDAVFGIDNLLIIHHTDCGLTHNTEESVQATLKDRFPDETASIEGMVFGAINKLEQSVMDDISFLRQSPLIRKEINLKGYIYHIDSGLLEEIV